MDELFTFVEEKKPAYLMTAIDRATRCIVGMALVWERTTAALQTLLDTSVWAANDFSDAFHLDLSEVYAGAASGSGGQKSDRRCGRRQR